jgi:large subunit ribosomal protein L15
MSGCIHNVHDGIKILGDVRGCCYVCNVYTQALFQGCEQLKAPVHIIASRASKSAIRAIEASGGTVFCQFYNVLALRDCVKGRTDRITAAPTARKDIGAHMHYILN